MVPMPLFQNRFYNAKDINARKRIITRSLLRPCSKLKPNLGSISIEYDDLIRLDEAET